MSVSRHFARPVSAGLPRTELTHDKTRRPIPSISSGRDATACANSNNTTKPPRVNNSENGLFFAPSKNAPPRPEQRQADRLQHTRHDQLPTPPRRGTPEALLPEQERRRQHRTARQRGTQRVDGVEGGLRAELFDVHPGGSQQGALDLREAVHRGHRRDRRAPPATTSSAAFRLPRLGQLVPAQGDLDAEHDRNDDQHRPAQPPVLAARSSLRAGWPACGQGPHATR